MRAFAVVRVSAAPTKKASDVAGFCLHLYRAPQKRYLANTGGRTIPENAPASRGDPGINTARKYSTFWFGLRRFGYGGFRRVQETGRITCGVMPRNPDRHHGR
jgi:hypothetical protein